MLHFLTGQASGRIMGEEAMQLFRFPCPHCSRVLKAPVEWAGRRGVCPSCQQSVVFPKTHLSAIPSRTAEQLRAVIDNAPDAPLMEEVSVDRFALLLAQGTCVEFGMARQILAERKLPVRQWRRILRLAAEREGMRMHLAKQPMSIADALDAAEAGDSSAAEALSADAVASDPGSIIIRFVHFMRHGTCPACKNDRTGLCCVYQTMDYFITTHTINDDRRRKWMHYANEIFGLTTGSAARNETPSSQFD